MYVIFYVLGLGLFLYTIYFCGPLNNYCIIIQLKLTDIYATSRSNYSISLCIIFKKTVGGLLIITLTGSAKPKLFGPNRDWS